MPLQPVRSLMLRSIVRRHPRLFARLGDHAGKRFGLDPSDLPFSFVLDTNVVAPRVVAMRELPTAGLDATIRGPFEALVGMVDGDYDGDALFFSRTIVVAGDIEAVLALRNAVDDAAIDLVNILAAGLGPFEKPGEAVLRRAFELGARGARLFDIPVPGRQRRDGSWN